MTWCIWETSARTLSVLLSISVEMVIVEGMEGRSSFRDSVTIAARLTDDR